MKIKLPKIKLRWFSFIDTLLKSPTRPTLIPIKMANAYGESMDTFKISPKRTIHTLISVVIGKKKYFFVVSLELVVS